ncbi:MAG: ABC-2 transporter permease [Defluviitaleaceae bacterium]|nr:ABC-2 transporter permease [Defluviitaleaceae bacterium]
MTTNNPMRGLLTLTWFKTRSKVLGALAYALVLGVIYLASEIEMIQMMFFMACMIYFPLQVLAGMSENEGRWERFQVSLPIKRSYLLKAQYLSVTIAAVFGGIILTIGIGISTAINEQWFNYGFASAILSSLHLYGTAFLAIGLCFILSLFIGNFAAWIIGLLAPTLVQVLVPIIAERAGISVYVLSPSVFVGSVVIFVASYFIMKTIYEKVDF